MLRALPLALLACLALLAGSARGGPARAQATVVWSGSGTLQGTFSFDFDGGGQTSAGADVFWQQQTSTARKLVPQNGAQLVNLGVRDFNSLAPEGLQGLAYSSNAIVGDNSLANQLVTGDVFAVRTSSGNLAKVKVVAYGYDLQLQWVTYKAYKLSVQKDGTGKGTVKSSPGGIACGSSCLAYFLAGSTVTVTATPDEGSALTKWDYSCTGSGGCSIPMNDDRSVKATFDLARVKLTVTETGPGSVTSAPGGIACGSTCAADFAWGTAVALTASPAAGASFVGWGGACSGTTSPCSVTVKTPASVTATFASLRIATVAFAVSWKQSRASGALKVSGVASPAGQLLLTLTPKAGGKAVFIRKVSVNGPFTSSLVLPRVLLPGAYVLTIDPTLGGAKLPSVKRPVKLAPPKEGVVAVAYISTTQKGKAVKEVPKGAKRLYAHFKFAPGALSKAKLTVEWYGPKGTLVGARPEPHKALIESAVIYPPGLEKGTWGCILRAGGVIVEDVFVRVA